MAPVPRKDAEVPCRPGLPPASQRIRSWRAGVTTSGLRARKMHHLSVAHNSVPLAEFGRLQNNHCRMNNLSRVTWNLNILTLMSSRSWSWESRRAVILLLSQSVKNLGFSEQDESNCAQGSLVEDPLEIGNYSPLPKRESGL